MAVTVTEQQNPFGNKIVEDTAATNQAVNNTTGDPGLLYMVEVDNTGYAAIVYFKLADALSATVGTTPAAMVLKCPASSKRSYVFPEGIAFSAGFCHWCVEGAAQADEDAPEILPTVRYIT